MKFIKIKDYIVNLNEIIDIEFDKYSKSLLINFKNDGRLLIEEIDQYYFKDLVNIIDML